MAQSVTPLPERKCFGHDERSVLVGYLDYHRAVLVRKAQGITDEQARSAACPPSDMTLLGLIRHMAEVERHWFRLALRGEEIGPLYYGEAHPDGDEDGDFHPPADATLAEAIESWRAEVTMADTIVGAHDLDDRERKPSGDREPISLREIIVHLIEEYARHCGHADLLRQAIDGATGD